MLHPYCQEALRLVEEGATPEQIDRVVKRDVGLAMGPFEVISCTCISCTCISLFCIS